MLQSVAVGGTNLLFTMLADDRDRSGSGGRKLILIGSVGYLISLGGHHMGLLRLWDRSSRRRARRGRARGPAPVHCGACIWPGGGDLGLYQRDLLRTSVRAQGQSLGSTTHWVMAAA